MAAFYWRRFLRLFPALALLCIALVALNWGSAPRLRDAIASLTYVANWTRAFDAGGPVYMGHSWSLAIEEQFYIVWPALLWALLTVVGRRRAVWAAVALAGLVMAWRGYATWDGYTFSRLYNGFDFRADGLLLGCALSLATFGRVAPPPSRHIGGPALVAAVVILALFVTFRESDRAMLAIGLSVANLAILIVVAYVALPYRRPLWIDRLLGSRVLVWLGDISYGVYLWHFPISFYLHTETTLGLWPKTLIVVAASLTIASLSYYLMERPLLNSHARARFTSAAGRSVLVYSLAAFVAGSWFFFEGNIRERLDPNYRIQIVNYGPQVIESGVLFNPQPDGNSALWLHTDSAVSTNAQIRFGTAMLPAVVADKVVSALVPARVIPPTGPLDLAIADKSGRTISNVVRIKIQTGPTSSGRAD